MSSQYWMYNANGSWKWTQRVPGEPRWIKNHVKGVFYQKGKAESALYWAERALQAASAQYHDTKSLADLRAMREAARDVQKKIANLEWQLEKIEHLQAGWLSMDTDGESRWLRFRTGPDISNGNSQISRGNSKRWRIWKRVWRISSGNRT